MIDRCEDWISRVNEVIQSKHPFANEKQTIDLLIQQATEIPVQVCNIEAVIV